MPEVRFNYFRPKDESRLEILEKIGSESIAWSDLPTKEEYINILNESGFNEINFQDKTDDWLQHTQSRLSYYRKVYGK